MSEIEHFTDLRVWRKAHQLFLDILADVDSFPRSRGADTVIKQILDASASISANISEGFNRSRKKFSNTLDIALGEANETENWLYKIRDAGFADENTVSKRLKAVLDIEKMLGSLMRKIRNNKNALREEPADYET